MKSYWRLWENVKFDWSLGLQVYDKEQPLYGKELSWPQETLINISSRSSAGSSTWPWLLRQRDAVKMHQCPPLKVSKKVFATWLLGDSASVCTMSGKVHGTRERKLPGEIDPTLAGDWGLLRAGGIGTFCSYCQMHVQALCTWGELLGRNKKSPTVWSLHRLQGGNCHSSLWFKTFYLFFRLNSSGVFLEIQGIAVSGDT